MNFSVSLAAPLGLAMAVWRRGLARCLLPVLLFAAVVPPLAALDLTPQQLQEVAGKITAQCHQQVPDFDGLQCQCMGQRFAAGLAGMGPEVTQAGSAAQKRAVLAAANGCRSAEGVREGLALLPDHSPAPAAGGQASVDAAYAQHDREVARECASGSGTSRIDYDLLNCDCVVAQQPQMRGLFTGSDSQRYLRAGCVDSARAAARGTAICESQSGGFAWAGTEDRCGCVGERFAGFVTRHHFALENNTPAWRNAMSDAIKACQTKVTEAAPAVQPASSYPKTFVDPLIYRCAGVYSEQPAYDQAARGRCGCFVSAWLAANPPAGGMFVDNRVFDAAVRDPAQFESLGGECLAQFP